MPCEDPKIKNSLERATRVKVFKRIIVGTLITLNLIPILFCIIVFIKMRTLESRVDELQQAVNQLIDDKSLVSSKNREQSLQFDATSPETVDVMVENGIETDSASNTEAAYDGMRKVYLTFDDGPSKYTGDILDILKKYNVKATFFVVGKESETYKDLYKRIADEGHTLGLHSYSHQYDEIYQSVDAYSADLTKLHDFLQNITGVDASIVRFPGGSSNTISEVPMQEFIGYLNDNGYVYFDWNISSGDAAEKMLTVQQIVSNVTDDLDKYSEAVILMHDASNRSTTVEALPLIIEKILKMDNTVILPITADTQPIQHIKTEK